MNKKTIKAISIVDSKVKDNSFTAYTIEIVYEEDEETVQVERRFRQFVTLDGLLKRYFKTFLGKLPSKAMFGNLNPVFVQSRVRQLQNYLQVLILDACVCSSPPFQSFRDPARNCMDEIEDFFVLVDREKLDSLASMIDGSSRESLELMKINHHTTWAGCGTGLAFAAAGATAVASPATLAAGAVTVAGCTAKAATAIGVVGAAAGAVAGTAISDKSPVTCAATGAVVGCTAGFLGTYIGVMSTVPVAVNSVVGYFGLSPLQYAILRNRSAAVHLLIDRRVTLSATCSCAGTAGWTPLHLAAHLNRVAAVQALLATPDGQRQLLARDSSGRTPHAVAGGVRMTFILLQAMEMAGAEPAADGAAHAAMCGDRAVETEGYV